MDSEKFEIQVTNENNANYATLRGVIDEDAKFEKLASVDGPLVINFREVESINSCGIRNWVNFMKELSDKDVYYAECTPLIVRQLNMIPSFAGNARILSVYMPYICDACDAEKMVIIEEKQFKGELDSIEEVIVCDNCGKEEMELDGHPQQYFAFAK